MMKMLRFEIKKVFSKTVNKIALVILMIALCIVSFFAISSVEYVDKEGNSTSGIVAAHHLRDEKNQWSGYLTEDMLSEVIEKMRKLTHRRNTYPKIIEKTIKHMPKNRDFQISGQF